MPKLTLEDKRRETLRRQLYGKEVASIKLPHKQSSPHQPENSGTFSLPDYQTVTTATQSTTAYLTKDLTKVLTFSILAVTAQLTLYLSLQNHLIKLSF